MKYKIGFNAVTEGKEGINDDTLVKNNAPEVRKSIVEVYFFDRECTYPYYNDSFNLKKGDIVYVEGKFEGVRGRVVKINYNFKIKLSDYKRVVSVAQTDVKGEFLFAGSHFITTDENALPYQKVATWFMPPEKEEDYVSSGNGETFNLRNLSEMKVTKEVAQRGHDYFIDNCVLYIELNRGKGRAIVDGRKPYQLEFDYKGEEISNLNCDCFCVGGCKHQVAAMLQLMYVIDVIKEKYPHIDYNEYVSAISKYSFCEFVVDGKEKGSFIMG